MKLLVGLGNPGSQYVGTRHNAGFWCLDALAHAAAFPAWSAKHKGHVTKGKLGTDELVLLKPQTFMNVSGESVQPAAAFYKIAPKDVLVIHDELDIPVGHLRYKVGGSDAGHNGLKSITQLLGTPDYARLRIGIGRPVHKSAVSDYVLQPPTAAEELALTEAIAWVIANLPALLKDPAATLAKRPANP